MRRRTLIASVGAFALVGCGKSRDGAPATATPAPGESAIATSAPSTTTPTPVAPPTASSQQPTATPVQPQQPLGFPIDPATRLGLVTGAVGSRGVRWGEGPVALEYSRDDQPSAESARANRCGWNARTHFEYEGQPAADWYVPAGTPVLATMDGLATLLMNTVSNPFDLYDVSPEPYIGDPDRARAPISPFPGPGGGQGVFMRIENDQFRTDYAHLEVARTVKGVPNDAFLNGYGSSFDYAATFAPLRDFRVATAIASWPVRKGDVIGYTGDTGYSEAPHLHYAIRRAGSNTALCPTAEPGFEDNGWLFRS